MKTEGIKIRIGKIIIAIIVTCITFSFFTLNVSAAASGDTTDKFEVGKYLKIDGGQTYLAEEEGKEGKTTKGDALGYFIIKTIEILTMIIGSFSLLFIIIGGITLMISHGNSQMQEKGKSMITYAIIGLVVVFTSLIIVTFVQSLFYTT
ncbi:pilin [Patescibacteria group bacterium]|nr:pilin [Patescibacteria group bacterium]